MAEQIPKADEVNAMSTKAFAYMRVSSKSQVDGDGFPRQMDAIQRYAKAHDVEIVEWFREEGVSGAKGIADRPAMQRMFTALHASKGKVRLVVIEALDRLARDLMIQEGIMAELSKYDFRIDSTQENELSQDDPTRVLIRQMMGAIASYQRAMIRARIAAGRLTMKAKGIKDGRKPYPDNADELSIYNKMKELRSGGLKCHEIAAILNAEDVPTRLHGTWHQRTVAKILER